MSPPGWGAQGPGKTRKLKGKSMCDIKMTLIIGKIIDQCNGFSPKK